MRPLKPRRQSKNKKLVLDGKYNFTVEKNKRADGPTPINLLKFGFATPVYLSDRDVTPPGISLHKGLVKQWGFIDSNIMQTPGSGVLGIIEIQDLQVTIINSQNPRFSDNFTTADPPENVTVDLYQWFAPLTYTEAQPLFKGIVYGQPKYDEYTCTLTIRGIFQKYNVKIGANSIITASVFPDADPDDIGKMSNIVYGSLIDVPCRALKAGTIDTLRDDLPIAETSFYVSGSAAADFPSGTVIVQIDDEQISGTYSQTTHRFTSCTRGYNSTTATAHDKGAQVAEILTSYVYEVAGHPVNAISAVRVDGVAQTSGYTAYTGQTGSVLTGYEGRAVIKFTALALLQKQVNLGINEGSHSHYVTPTVVTWPFQTVTPTGSCSSPGNIIDGNLSSLATFIPGIYADIAYLTRTTSQSYTGTPKRVRVGLKVGNINGYALQFTFAGADTMDTGYVWDNSTVISPWVTLGTSYNSWVKLVGATGTITHNSAVNVEIYEAWAEIEYSNDASYGPATGVALTGNSSAETVIGTLVTCDAQGYQDDNSGTYTGAANALITCPDHVFKHIWAVILGASIADIDLNTFAASGAFFAANSYAFSFLINEQIQADELLTKLALQCRSRFIVSPSGKAKLIVRQLGQASGHPIIKNEIKKDSMSIERSPTGEIINTLNIGYDLNLSESPGSLKSYRSALPLTNSTSITRYGTRTWQGSEDVFCFNAIRLAAMASHVGAFLLAYHCRVRKMPTFGVFLDNIEIQPGDIIDVTHTLDSMSGFVAEVLKINHHIGNKSQIDWLEITGIENAT
jgi:hypothetical protein